MIYIDNNASTKIDEEVLKAMEPYLREEYGNPGSKHYTLATNAKKAVEKAREQVAQLINAEADEIIFTSSGSESNNFVIKGVADYLKNYEEKGNHLITSKVEHKSVINSFKFLNGDLYRNKEQVSKVIDRGYEVDFADVNEYGQVEIETLNKLITDKTILGSFIWVNNELGNINDMDAIGELFHEKDIFLHADGTQAVGKMDVDMKKLKIDGLSFSAHKIHGPKGVGAVYLRKDGDKHREVSATLHGGGDQEFGYRAGTPSVHNIVGFGKAAELAKKNLDENRKRMIKMENKFIQILKDKYPEVIIVSDRTDKVPGLISYIVPGLNNQEYIKRLSDDVALSFGSACSDGTESEVLSAIGRGEYGANFFRVGLSKYNTEEEFEKLIKLL